MESIDGYNFSLFKPRNLHGRKNRNVILTMLLIWAVAVFGFQILLRVIERPTPEKALISFRQVWPGVRTGVASDENRHDCLVAVLQARGKNTLRPEDQKLISDAITSITFQMLTDSLKAIVTEHIKAVESLRSQLASMKGEAYLELKGQISDHYKAIHTLTAEYTMIDPESLESDIFNYSLQSSFSLSLQESEYDRLEDIMSLYMTHNQSFLTDSIVLGFPFHYLYTAFFLLVLFVLLCIIYNILIEWRLGKEGVLE